MIHEWLILCRRSLILKFRLEVNFQQQPPSPKKPYPHPHPSKKIQKQNKTKKIFFFLKEEAKAN